MLPEKVNIALDFIEKINRGDVDGIAGLLAPNHIFEDIQGDTEAGKGRISEVWRRFLESHPEYRIYIRRVFDLPNGVALSGHTTGSNLDFSESEEFHGEGMIWTMEIEDGLLTSWKLHPDTIEHHLQLDLHDEREVFAPAWIAETIAKHLDLLPADSRTNDIRNIRTYYSRLYRHAPPEVMVRIAGHLFFDEGYRFVPYELLHHHPGALQTLSREEVEKFGEGINSWSSTDMYASLIAGPAWKLGIIADEVVEKWVRSPDLWWRRAALVSTIYPRGNPEKMLRFATMLVDDKEDMIVKALSWVLREATKFDRQGVEQFLQDNNRRLAARVKREVRNKLETGLKNP